MSRSFAAALLIATSAGIAAGPPASPPGGCGGGHVVVRGDTLYSIARRCQSSVAAIARASGLADPRRIEIGQQLVIPGAGPAAEPEPAKPEPAAAPLVYTFQPGDTLYSLARWARVGVGPLIAANPGINPHKIEIGDAIRLPAGAVPPGAARLRERGTGPGPAYAPPPPPRPAPPPPPPAAPPPRAHDDHPRPPPAPPPRMHDDRRAPPAAPHRDKPDDDEERAPEGM